MKRALCTVLFALLAGAPAASAGPRAVEAHLERAERSLDRAEVAFDRGHHARFASALRAADHRTALGLQAALRLAAQERRAAPAAVGAATEVLALTAGTVLDLLPDATAGDAQAIGRSLIAADTGRRSTLRALAADPDWRDALLALAADGAAELALAGEIVADLGAPASGALDRFVAAAAATVASLVDAGLDGEDPDPELLEALEADLADAAEVLAGTAPALDALVERIGMILDDLLGAGEDDPDDEREDDEDSADDWDWLDE